MEFRADCEEVLASQASGGQGSVPMGGNHVVTVAHPVGDGGGALRKPPGQLGRGGSGQAGDNGGVLQKRHNILKGVDVDIAWGGGACVMGPTVHPRAPSNVKPEFQGGAVGPTGLEAGVPLRMDVGLPGDNVAQMGRPGVGAVG